MNKIREWYQMNVLTDLQYSLLISVVCESVEKLVIHKVRTMIFKEKVMMQGH